MKNKKYMIAAVAVIAAALASYLIFFSDDDEPKFRTEKLTRGDVVENVTASGSVNAVVTVLVGTQVSGTIKQLYVDYNSRVKKGQLLAQIDPLLLQAQVEQAKANLLKLEANTTDAKRTRDRNRQLFEKNLIARSDVDTAEANYDAFEAQVAAARAALNSARINLQYTRILSPVDGIVISRSVDVGQTVAASFQTPTLFTIAQDLTKMQVDTAINEADIGKVKEGQSVEFTVDAYPDVTFKGKVFQVRNAPVTVQNVVTYTVVIQVDNPDMKLRPGMTANASITTNLKKDVLKLPNAALRVRMPSGSAAQKPQQTAKPGQTGQRGPGVWALEGEKPRRMRITPGITDGNYTEIAGGDLKEGMDIIVEVMSKAKKPAAAGQGQAPGGLPRRI